MDYKFNQLQFDRGIHSAWVNNKANWEQPYKDRTRYLILSFPPYLKSVRQMAKDRGFEKVSIV